MLVTLPNFSPEGGRGGAQCVFHIFHYISKKKANICKILGLKGNKYKYPKKCFRIFLNSPSLFGRFRRRNVFFTYFFISYIIMK